MNLHFILCLFIKYYKELLNPFFFLENIYENNKPFRKSKGLVIA